MSAPHYLKEKMSHGTVRFPFSSYESSITDSNSSLYLHWHEEMELFLVLEGTALFSLEDSSFYVGEGEAVFLSANQLHSAAVPSGTFCRFFAFVFHTSFLSGNVDSDIYLHYIAPLLQNRIQFPHHLTSAAPWSERIIKLLKDLSLLSPEDGKYNELLIKSILYEIWHHLYHNRTVSSSMENGMALQLAPVFQYIHSHYREPITIRTLARQASLSVSQLCKIMRKYANMSPGMYLTRYRIKISCCLLQTTRDKITGIAAETGFTNISNYNRTFKRLVGCTPKEYRIAMNPELQ